MAAQKFIALVSGVLSQVSSLVTSAGSASAGAIPALDGTGRLDVTMMPLGVGPDIEQLPAFEALAAGSYVNVFSNAGVKSCRLADNSNARPAHGFVKVAVAAAGTAVIYDGVPNEAVSGKTIAAREYLGTAGATIETPLDPTLVANVGKIHQYLGLATDATAIDTAIADYVVL